MTEFTITIAVSSFLIGNNLKRTPEIEKKKIPINPNGVLKDAALLPNDAIIFGDGN